jgi:putative membrane protein
LKNILIKEELKAILRNKKLLIPIIAVLFIPVMYAGMFLWAFWDPYDKLDDLPVAVVNEDIGAELDGKSLSLGKDLVDKLKESKDFNYKFVEKEEGYDDLKNQKYYMLIEIPKNFSENATTLLDQNPQKLKLVYVPNESYNFLSSQIGGTAVDRIKASLSEKITETYAETMFDKIGDLADGVTKASEGAAKLSDGSLDLKSGSEELHAGLSTLAEKSIEFNNGMKKADSGVNQLTSGSATLSDGLGQLQEGEEKLETASSQLKSGNEELAEGISKTKQGLQAVQSKLPEAISGTKELEAGASTLSSSLKEWRTEAEKASAGAQQLNSGILELKGKLDELGLNDQQKVSLKGAIDQFLIGSETISTGTKELASYAGQFSTGASTLSVGLEDLGVGQIQLQQGIGQLTEGSVNLETGAKKLVEGQREFATGIHTFGEKFAEAKAGSDKIAQGSNELSGGMNQLSNGSTAMVTGAGKLEEGSGKLAGGTVKISEGSKELADKLSDGVKEASKVDVDDKTFNMMADPVKVDNEKINHVPNYGTGFAPYFLSLGLFVGALLLSIVFPLREPAVTPANGFSWFTSKFVILAGIGVIQALLADAILLAGLGLKVESISLFILFSITTSLTFIALVQFLVTMFGDPGRFIAIIILILQLTTSAGTFPLELVPGFLKAFNAFLPMTYSVHGFKEVISSGDFSSMYQDVMILFIFMLSFALGTLAYFNFKYKRQFQAVVD